MKSLDVVEDIRPRFGARLILPSVDAFPLEQADVLGAPIFVPFTTVYLAIWNPAGNAIDYTVNLGFDERSFQHFENIEDVVRDNNHLHMPCTEPYPGN